MRKLLFLAACVVAFPTVTPAALIWDNYQPGGQSYLGEPGPGFDGVSAKSSERNTRIDDAWTGDDAVFTQSVRLDSIKWIGLLEQEQGAQFTAADVIIFRDPGQFPIHPDDLVPYIVYQQSNLSLDMALGINAFGGRRIYEGTVDLPAVQLPAGHYYYAVRVVGNLLGRNYVTTTGFGNLLGQSMGVYQSDTFLYPPDSHLWTYVNHVPGTAASDYSYRIYGEVVPEPASLVLLGLGALALLKRR
jgi:hypothetical protein